MSKQPPDWPTFLRGAMEAAGIRTASELARQTGVGESLVSRWLRGANQPDVTTLRKLAPVLKQPMLALLVAAGHLSTDEAKVRDVQVPERPMVAVPDAIEADEDLLPEARAHLLNQYELLLRLQAAAPPGLVERQGERRRLAAVARTEGSRPTVTDDDTEAGITERALAAVKANPHARKRRT